MSMIFSQNIEKLQRSAQLAADVAAFLENNRIKPATIKSYSGSARSMVLEYLKDHPRSTGLEIEISLGMKKSTIDGVLCSLRSAKKVKRVSDCGAYVYEVTSE